jgi:hypothetical protein
MNKKRLKFTIITAIRKKLIPKVIFHILIQESSFFVLVGIPMAEILWEEIVLSTSIGFLNHYSYAFRE